MYDDQFTSNDMKQRCYKPVGSCERALHSHVTGNCVGFADQLRAGFDELQVQLQDLIHLHTVIVDTLD